VRKIKYLYSIQIYLLIILFLPCICFAEIEDPLNPCLSKSILKDGFYFGIAGGYDIYAVKDDIDFTKSSVAPFSLDSPITTHGVAGGIFVGFGRYFERFYHIYLGAEGFMNGSSADSDRLLI